MSRPARCTRGKRKGRCAVTNPCYGCKERRVGCHSDCTGYKAWCEAEQRRKDAEVVASYNDKLRNEYVQESKRRYKRRTGKK